MRSVLLLLLLVVATATPAAAAAAADALVGGQDASVSVYTAGYFEHHLYHFEWYDSVLVHVTPATASSTRSVSYSGLFSTLTPYSVTLNTETLNSYALLGGYERANDSFVGSVAYANVDVGVPFSVPFPSPSVSPPLIALVYEPASKALVAFALDAKPGKTPSVTVLTSKKDRPILVPVLDVPLSGVGVLAKDAAVSGPTNASVFLVQQGNGTVVGGIQVTDSIYVAVSVAVKSDGKGAELLHVSVVMDDPHPLYPLWVVYVESMASFVAYLDPAGGPRNTSVASTAAGAEAPFLAVVDVYSVSVIKTLTPPVIPLVPSIACPGPDNEVYVFSKNVLFVVDPESGAVQTTTPLDVGNFMFTGCVAVASGATTTPP